MSNSVNSWLRVCALLALSAGFARGGVAQDPGGQVQRPECMSIERELFQVGGSSHSLRFSPDGALLASGGDRGDVAIYDANTGALMHTFEASDHWLGALRFSPDGARLAVVGRSVTLWDVASGKKLGETASKSANSLDWSPDGSLLAVVQGNGRAVLLNASDLSEVQALALPGPTAVDAIAFDHTSSKVAVGKRSGETFVFDVASGRRIDKLEQPDWVHGLAWLVDGRLLRLGWKGALRGAAGEDLSFEGNGYSMVASADGSRILVRSSKAVLEFQATAQTAELVAQHDLRGPVALHPNGKQWAIAAGAQLSIYEGSKVVRSFASSHREAPGDAVMTGDGRYAVVVGVRWSAGTTQVFEVATGRRIQVAGFPTTGELIANPQGTEVVVHAAAKAEDDSAADELARELQYWAVLPPPNPGAAHVARLVRKVPFRLQVRTANPDCPPGRLSSDSRYFSHGDQVIDLQDDARSHRPDRILISETHAAGEDCLVARIAMHSHLAGQPGRGQLLSFVRAPDGNAITLHRLRRLNVAPRCIAPTPDGRQVAVALRDSIEVLTVPELENARTLPHSVRDLVWVADHHALATGHGDELMLLHMRTGELLQTLRLGTWVRRIDYHPARAVALVTVQDRTLIVRLELPAK